MSKAEASVKVKKELGIVRYLRETRAELRKVHWPTREEAWNLTKVVAAVTIAMTVFLGLLDAAFAWEARGIFVELSIVNIVIGIVAIVGVVVTAVVLARQSS